MNKLLDFFRNNPNASVQTVTLDLNLPQGTIRRCGKTNNVKSFTQKFLHTLQIGDEEKSLEYCLWG